jgi:glutamine synthetase
MTFAARCGVHDAARAAACDAVLERVAKEHVEQVRVAWADLHGSLRGKTLVCGFDASPVTQALQSGVGMVSTLLLKDTSDRTAFKVFEPGGAGLPAGFGAANNLVLLPDPASYLALPWAPGTGWMRAEPWFDDGTLVPADPRRVLRRALAVLGAAGFGLRCGLEVEFHVFRITQERLALGDAAWPAEPPAVALLHPGYQLLSESWADQCAEPLDIVRRTALALGLPLRSLEIELGPSQFEAVFGPTDALTAADHMVLFRNGVRQALRRAGYHASFVCRPPFEGAVASGWHLHHSLVHADDGRNAMGPEALAGTAAGDGIAAGSARHWLGEAGAHWLAGLLAHAHGMAALCAPSVNAYGRYRGSVMAPQSVQWGRDNRGALLRVVGNGRDLRIENRLGEPLANPYLAIASQVWAGLDGMARRLEPPPATDAPYAAGAALLPATLAEALDALAADSVLQQGLGEPMAQVFHAIKRQELARHDQAEDAALWERREYFGRH